ncbi:MAG: aldehyde dehydrogenase family protein [Actinomycetota bacterium]|jgi:aldehyde dehydrogenase
MSEIPMIIDGRPVESDRHIEVRNPADLAEVVGRVPDASPDDVDAAARAAAIAFPEWAARPVTERANLLHGVGSVITDLTDDLTKLLTREHGKVLWESGVDLFYASAVCHLTASLAEGALKDTRIRDTGGTTVIRRCPVGPVAAIVPWNFPVVLSFMKIAPALLAGNTVVLKPSELVPLTITRVIQEVQKYLPPGVLNVVTGGDDTGANLVGHPLIRKVAFTGGTETGTKVMQAAARDVKRVTLELGGNDAALVLDDAELTDDLVGGLVRGVYTSTGTLCFSVKRIYVPAQAFDLFVDRFCAAVDRLVVGRGDDPGSSIGPINNEQQLRAVEKLLDEVEASGATVRRLGQRLDPAGWDRGHFMLPSVVTGLAPDAPLVTEEQFGPTVPILPYRTLDEGLRLVNDTRYGLCSSVWSSDEDRAFEVGRRVEAGSVFINSHVFDSLDPRAPFGGMKSSGLGREFGAYAFDSYTEYQTISRRTGPPGEPLPH